MSNFSLDPWVVTALEISLKSLVLTGFTFFMLFCLRTQAAKLRHQICAIGLLSLPLLLISPLILPTISIPIFPARTQIASTADISLDHPKFDPNPLAISKPIYKHHNNSQKRPEFPYQESQKENPFTFPWPSLIWVFGTSLVLFSFSVDIGRRNRLTRQARPVSNITWPNHITYACQQFGFNPAIKVLKNGNVQIPLTYGWRNPVLLLPLEAEDWSTEQQRAVLLHEIAHIKRKDQLIQSLCHISNALFWFNPIVWILKRRLQTEQERACDDLVITMGISAPDYATHLLNIVRTLNPSSHLATVPIARKADLPDRIRLILDDRIDRKPTPLFTSVFAVIFIGTFTLAIAPLHTAQIETPSLPISDLQITLPDVRGRIMVPDNDPSNPNTPPNPSVTGPPPLINATKNGDLREVRHLLAGGADPNQLEGGGPPLLVALRSGYQVIAKELMDHGADLSLQSTFNGETILMIATAAGNIDLARQAIKKGVDINALSQKGDSALHLAARGNHLEILKMLLELGAEVNIRGYFGTTPLFTAAQNGNSKIVEQLLTHGADAQARSMSGNTALSPAITNAHVDVVRLLLSQGLDANERLVSGFYPLQAAVRNVSLVKLLLDYGADPQVTLGFSRTTPLQLAISGGYNDTAALLLEKTERKQGTLYGLISDQKTGGYIGSGRIIIIELDLIIPIGKGGMYYLSDIPMGSYTLRADVAGYRTQPTQYIKIRDGFATSYHMSLLPD
jgi:ankyrin repeat protein/beta-lactamase regulating signal transducer with metallopeptidase domain